MKSIVLAGAVFVAALVMPASSYAAAPAATVSAAGVVQQVEAEQGRVKLSHDAIPALGWPKMTMFFRVRDKALLKGIAAGDAVRFELEKDAAGQAITRMEKVTK